MADGKRVWAAPAHAEHREAVPAAGVGHGDGVVGCRKDRPLRMHA